MGPLLGRRGRGERGRPKPKPPPNSRAEALEAFPSSLSILISIASSSHQEISPSRSLLRSIVAGWRSHGGAAHRRADLRVQGGLQLVRQRWRWSDPFFDPLIPFNHFLYRFESSWDRILLADPGFCLSKSSFLIDDFLFSFSGILRCGSLKLLLCFGLLDRFALIFCVVIRVSECLIWVSFLS